MRVLPMIFAAALAATPLVAQQGPPPFDHSVLAFFDKLAGEWTGTAWIVLGPDGRHNVVQRESAKWVAGKTVFVVEGLGVEKMPDGTMRTVHDAFATIYVDRDGKTPRMRAFVASGQWQDMDLKVLADGYDWAMTVPGDIRIRYEMRFDSAGRWVEKGFMSRDQGATWIPNFEMTLSRVKP